MPVDLPEDGSPLLSEIKDGYFDPIWVRAGAAFDVALRLDGNDRPFQFSIVTPADTEGGERITLGTARFERLTPLTREENDNLERLLRAVGGVVIGSGRAEAAMKRILLLQARSLDFSTVDFVWSELLKRLQKIRDDVEGLGELLDWAEESRVTSRRDNTVHAQWWDIHDGNTIRSRMARRADAAPMLARLVDSEEDARVLEEFAYRLDALVGRRWPTAVA